MMPKGVEHSLPDEGVLAEARVRIPMMPKGVEHKAKACAADAAVLNAFRHHRVVSTALPEAPIAPSKTIAARAKRAATESLPVAAFVVLVNLFLRFVILRDRKDRGRRLGSFCLCARSRCLG